MSRRKFTLFLICYFLLLTSYSVYSYAHLDLNLTLSSNPVYQSIQKPLIHLGYFNRPLSTAIFFVILGLMTLFYLLLVILTGPIFSLKKSPARQNPAPSLLRRVGVGHGKKQDWCGAQFTTNQLWLVIITAGLILLLSYPALAHDLFNYIFDARIVVKHHANPWVMTPLDFPTDPWTRFMRWTHVASVYPPGWIITTIPFYLLGLGKFTLTLLSFKLLGLVSFLSSSWLMLKLAGRRAWILWSFNPMVLIESLSSVHNDAVMVAFTLLAFFLVKKGPTLKGLTLKGWTFQRIVGYLALIWGGLIKYLSWLLIPFLKSPQKAAIVAWIGSLITILLREINPWYLLLPVALSFMSQNNKLTKFAVLASLISMYRYWPCVAIFSC